MFNTKKVSPTLTVTTAFVAFSAAGDESYFEFVQDKEANVTGVDFYVNEKFENLNALSSKEGVQTVRQAIRVFKKYVASVPQGTVFSCEAYQGDAYGHKRA